MERKRLGGQAKVPPGLKPFDMMKDLEGGPKLEAEPLEDILALQHKRTRTVNLLNIIQDLLILLNNIQDFLNL